MLGKIVGTAKAANKLLNKYTYTDPAMEAVYRSLFLRELERSGIPDEYYPIGAAANHSFLYFLARLLKEFEFSNVLELGAGQSSLLIDRMSTVTNRIGRVRTVEHDPLWAESIRSKVKHEVLPSPLRPTKVGEHETDYYDLSPQDVGTGVDLLIVDGPPAFQSGKQFARLGVLQFIPHILAEDFVLIVDDAERRGEMLLTNMLEKEFRKLNIAAELKFLVGAKRQAVFTAGRYRPAGFF